MRQEDIARKVQIDELLKQEIRIEIRETLATEISIVHRAKRVFTAADLWQIHRRRRSFSRR